MVCGRSLAYVRRGWEGASACQGQSPGRVKGRRGPRRGRSFTPGVLCPGDICARCLQSGRQGGGAGRDKSGGGKPGGARKGSGACGCGLSLAGSSGGGAGRKRGKKQQQRASKQPSRHTRTHTGRQASRQALGSTSTCISRSPLQPFKVSQPRPRHPTPFSCPPLTIRA